MCRAAVLTLVGVIAFVRVSVAGDFDFKPSSHPVAPPKRPATHAKAPARPVRDPVAIPAPAPAPTPAVAAALAPAPAPDRAPAPARSAEPVAVNLPSAAPLVTSAPPSVVTSATLLGATAPSASLTIPGLGARGAALAPPSVEWNGSMRFRYEARSILDYRVPGQLKRPVTQQLDEAGDQSLMRLRVGAKVKFSPLVRGEFVVQDARVMGIEGAPGTAIANMDLFDAYVDVDSIFGAPLVARVGRQVLTYGDEKILAGSNWGNPGRGWDGVRLRFQPKGWQVDAFGTWVMEGRVEGNDRMFSGADALWKGAPGIECEGYAFARSFGDTSFTSERGGPKGSLDDLTSGARFRARRGAAEVRLEGAAQSGKRAGDRVAARFATARASWEFHGTRKPRLTLEGNWASGDADPTDGKAGRFDPIYWGNHGYQGAMDIFDESNSRDLALMTSLQATRLLNLQCEYHQFTLADAHDAWYDDSGNALRRDATGASGTAVGSELDLTARWDPRSGLGLLAGVSSFIPGHFVHQTGGAPQQDWGFLQMTVTF